MGFCRLILFCQGDSDRVFHEHLFPQIAFLQHRHGDRLLVQIIVVGDRRMILREYDFQEFRIAVRLVLVFRWHDQGTDLEWKAFCHSDKKE